LSKFNTKTTEKPKTFFEKKWVAIGLIILVSAIIYSSSLNAPFIFDDEAKIVNNPDIKEIKNIKTKLIYPQGEHKTFERNDPSRPVTYLTFTLNYYFGKLNIIGYHLVNIFLHVCVSILIFFLTRKIIVYTYGKCTNIFPFFVALFFASHPINTIVVSYVFNRSGELAAFFYILSLLLFTKTFEKGKKFYVFSLLCFILGIFSKQDAITLPAILLIFDYIFLSNFELAKVIKKKYYHLSYWVIIVIFLLFRYFYLGTIGDADAGGTLFWNHYTYFVIQPYVILRYLKFLFIPKGLCFDHYLNPAESIFEFKIMISVLFVLLILVATWLFYRRKTNISKIFLFSILWFIITISPTSSFFPTTTAMAENRLYLPGYGFYFIIVSVYFLIFRVNPDRQLELSGISTHKRLLNSFLIFLLGVHIIVLCIATVKRNRLYQNPALLWEEVISMYPSNYRATQNASNLYNELGNSLRGRGEYIRAVQEYQKALELKPDSAEIHYNLGLAYYEQRIFDRAIQEFKRTIEINPNHSEAHNNLGTLYFNRGEYDNTFQEYQKAVKINPDYAQAHNNLGILYYYQKEYRKALQEFQIVLMLKPYDQDAKDKIEDLKKRFLDNK